VEKCIRGRYQPLLLLYALPQQTSPTSGYHSDASVASSTVISPNRRAITPSPEKPPIGLTRRAITPTPNRSICEYQNLSVIQNKIFNHENEETDAYISRKAVENVMNAQYQNLNVIQEKIMFNKSNILTSSGNSSSSSEEKDFSGNGHSDLQIARKQQLARSLSAESASLSTCTIIADGLTIPDHMNQPRRRDSGNWSGDRNSASSSSSTTLDNPYLYLMNKRNSSVPPSPTRNGHFHDAGYDSYSLSSTDSYPPKHPVMHLAKIPESVSSLSGDCEKLCLEADQLLEKSKLVEDALDFETALVLCNAAASKARAAMNAPYSNPHTMTFARMKHNTCVMRSRSLYRRILMDKGSEFSKDQTNTNSLNGPRHNRQNSKDKTMQRQNSKEMLHEDKFTTKNIEIYATLPKKKVSLKLVDQEEKIDTFDAPTEHKGREGRGLFGRSKESKEKRSRSEDRNKSSRDFESAALTNAKDTLKKHKEEKEEKKDKEKTNKKQHKIRRKLLMGGLIRRKNRSMPDLTEAAGEAKNKEAPSPQKTVDDSSVGVGDKKELSAQSGYLSEGHLEYHVSNVNPTLERSKLMRKSFHGSGRQLVVVAKVPPPPPLRKTSALTSESVDENNLHQKSQQTHFYPSHDTVKPFHEANMSIISNVSSNTSMSEDSCQTIITCAQVHQEQSPLKFSDMISAPSTYNQKFTINHLKNDSVDEVDNVGLSHTRFNSQLELPPYPSPPATTCHSRQASEDFPPPPPFLIDLEPLNEQLNEIQSLQIKRADSLDTIQGCTSILAHLQQRQEALKVKEMAEKTLAGGTSENWIKELQLKQMAFQKGQCESKVSENGSILSNNVRDLTTRFEQAQSNVRTGMNGLLKPTMTPHTIKRMENGDEVEYAIVDKKKNQIKFEVPQSQVQEELREVEMLNQVVHNTLNNANPMKRIIKKKSVSFCDQVILVATANDEEDDTFIQNPILERVLKSINGVNDEEGKDQVDALKSNILATKQIPLQAPHESSPGCAINTQNNNLLFNDSPKMTTATATSTVNNPIMFEYQASSHIPKSQNYSYLNQPLSRSPQQHYQEMNPFAHRKQEILDYSINQGVGLTNLGIPLQSAQPMLVSSPYMQILPQNSAIRQENALNFSYAQASTNSPNSPQNPPFAQQMNYLPNSNRLGIFQAQQKNQNLYQKKLPIQHEFLTNNVHFTQNNYQRINYVQQETYDHHLPLNPLNPLSQYQEQNGVYLSPAHIKPPAQKKVSFGPDTKQGSDGNSSPSSTGSSDSAHNNNNNIGAVTSLAIGKSSPKSLCNLCRKQPTIGTSLYCVNCDSYLSRFNANVRRYE
jgi:hypothetical protein